MSLAIDCGSRGSRSTVVPLGWWLPRPQCRANQLHSSLAGRKSGHGGMDDVLLPAPPLDADAALEPDTAVDP